MEVSSVKFRTNIDCCKHFMTYISGLPFEMINPMVGDRVRVYHDSEFEVYMKVSARYWTMINGSSPVLNIWLIEPNGLNIPDFEKVLKNRGFSLC